jgi:uncharacterized protein (TIRG00374 family)
VGHTVLRVLRWRVLLEPTRPGLRFRPMFVAVMIGYMTSWVIPGRMGELVRPLLLSAREGVPLGPSIGSVVADRLLDGAAVVVLFAAGSWMTTLEGEAAEYVAWVRGSAIVLVVGVVLVLAVMILVSSAGGRLTGWLGGKRGPLRWIGRALISLADGVAALRSPWRLLRIVGYSLLIWLIIAAGTWIGVLAIGADVPYAVILVIQPLLVLGVAVPTPGGAGSFHGAVKVGLMLFGVAQLVAVSAGLLLHAIFTVPVILLGILLIWTDRVSWRDLLRAARQFRSLGDLPAAPAESRTAEGLS